MNEKKKSKLGVLILAGIIVFAGFVVVINLQQQIVSGSSVYQIKNFDSYKELTHFLVASNQNIGRYGSSFNGMLSAPTVNYDMAEGAIATKQGGTSVDYSKTNVQVPGVDEPDIVKTDGTYLYIVSYNNVIIVKAYPAGEAAIISEITFNDSLSISNIFIDGTRLVVFTQTNNYPILYNTISGEGSKNFWYNSPDTYVKIYDLEDISNPVLKKDIVIGGSFSGARLIGSYVYVITTQYSYSSDENQTIVPLLMVDGKTLEVPLSDIYYVDIPEKSSTLTNIVSINIHDDSEEIHQKIFLLGTTQTLYVSEKNIYVTYSMWYYDYPSLEKILDDKLLPMLPDSAKTQLDTVKTLNLEDYQKQTIAQWIIQNYVKSLSDEQKSAIVKDIASETEKTIIHRISIDAGEIKYEAQGTVIGYVGNQFSLSEYNGYLRVSTTLQGTTLSSYIGSLNPQNNIYVLDKDLKIVGSLEGIAPGESIYATRFVDNICYLVTFRQTDPFFVIDLSDPTSPQVLGQLKIPGYSTYLHPYDETHIIGVGRDGEKVKISLFDVSDMSNPIELSNYSIENNESGWWWSESSALYEHKAFLFDKAKNLLVIPAGSYNKQLAYVFSISVENGISLKGTISHDAEVQTQQENGEYKSYYYDDGNSIQRTMYIENVLYTISKNMVKMNSLDDLSEINSVNLE
jgi:inhibitor of cysteine peptidase